MNIFDQKAKFFFRPSRTKFEKMIKAVRITYFYRIVQTKIK